MEFSTCWNFTFPENNPITIQTVPLIKPRKTRVLNLVDFEMYLLYSSKISQLTDQF